MAQTDTTGQLSWLLDNLVSQVEHVQQAVILSRDGLVVAASQGLTREDGDHLSALAAGVQSLARGAGRHFRGGEVRQTIIEMEQAFLFVIAAGKGTCLAVLTSAEANVGLIAYEMAMLVRRMGKYLAAEPRFPEHEIARMIPRDGHGERWFDQEAGPVVRPYAVTKGRTLPNGGASLRPHRRRRRHRRAAVRPVPARPGAPADPWRLPPSDADRRPDLRDRPSPRGGARPAGRSHERGDGANRLRATTARARPAPTEDGA